MCRQIIKLFFNKFGTIREVRESDVTKLFSLSNDPVVRNNSLESKKINWNSHVQWFKEKLNNRNYVIYIVSIFWFFIGQVKFEICKNNNEAVISISLISKVRGLGLSSLIISKSLLKFIDKNNIHIIKAYILKNNIISERSFIQAGFIYNKTEYLKNRKVETFIKKVL